MSGYVLLVDDDEDDLEWTASGLKQHRFPYQLRMARDGAEALELLRQAVGAGTPLPLLILLDIKMPRMSGLELLERISEDSSLRSVPVVLLSSSQNEQDIQRAFALGAKAYLPKAAEFGSLRRIVDTVHDVLAGCGEAAPLE